MLKTTIPIYNEFQVKVGGVQFPSYKYENTELTLEDANMSVEKF